MKWFENIQKTLMGLKLRRQINKLLRILYFEFKDLADRAKKRRENPENSLCEQTSKKDNCGPKDYVQEDYIHEYQVYYDADKEIVLFKSMKDEKDSNWTYYGNIEQMVGGNWEYWSPPNEGQYLSWHILQSILRKCYELKFERDSYYAKLKGRPSQRIFRWYAITDAVGDECYRVFEKGLYDDFVCECASEYYANLIVDNLNERFNK